MSVTLIKNILPEEKNKSIIRYLCNNVSWNIAYELETPYEILFNSRKHLGFSHISHEKNEQELNDCAMIVMNTVLKKMKLKGKCHRFMWNMYYRKQESYIHVDHDFNNFISILYNLHTTDGGTEVDNKFYKDLESEAKIFKSNIKHKGVGPKKDYVRFNLNIIVELL